MFFKISGRINYRVVPPWLRAWSVQSNPTLILDKSVSREELQGMHFEEYGMEQEVAGRRAPFGVLRYAQPVRPEKAVNTFGAARIPRDYSAGAGRFLGCFHPTAILEIE